jgi:hypothetical protein
MYVCVCGPACVRARVCMCVYELIRKCVCMYRAYMSVARQCVSMSVCVFV